MSGSLNGVGLVFGVGSLELGQDFEVRHDRLDVGELRHVDAEALSVVHLGGQEGVSETQNVAEAVLALGLFDGLLEVG